MAVYKTAATDLCSNTNLSADDYTASEIYVIKATLKNTLTIKTG